MALAIAAPARPSSCSPCRQVWPAVKALA
jgi:hypothetical protein